MPEINPKPIKIMSAFLFIYIFNERNMLATNGHFSSQISNFVDHWFAIGFDTRQQKSVCNIISNYVTNENESRDSSKWFEKFKI